MQFFTRLRRKIKRHIKRYSYNPLKHPLRAIRDERLRRKYFFMGFRWGKRAHEKKPAFLPPPVQSAYYEPPERHTDPLKTPKYIGMIHTRPIPVSDIRRARELQQPPPQTGPIPRRYVPRTPDKRTRVLHPHHLERPATEYMQAYKPWQGDEWVK